MPHGSFDPEVFRGDFVGGRFVPVRRGTDIVSEDPGDRSRPVGRVRSDAGVVDESVDAARRAFPGWSGLRPAARLGAVRRFGREVRRRAKDLAWAVARESGKPWAEAWAEAGAVAEKVDLTLRSALPLVADQVVLEEGGRREVLRRRPRGVAAVIGPFNVPAHLPNGQILPSLAVGNTVVFKPSELAPFTGQVLAECLAASDLPPGVFNLVQGGGVVGARLAAHAGVDTVFFTGSDAVGARLRAACAGQPWKRLALEMGGKNAALVLPDAPLEATVREVVHGAFATSGQRCSATSRVLVHRRAAAAFLQAFLARVDALHAGYFTDGPDFGPLARASAVDRWFRSARAAEGLGFETLRAPRRLRLARSGHYVSPAVRLRERGRRFWTDPGTPRAYWDEELFAPDVAVYVLDSEEEMAELNDASRYGLVASVFTASRAAFERLRPCLRNGVVHWNRTTAMTPGRLPFGGLKDSGSHWPAGLFVPFAATDPIASVEVTSSPSRADNRSGSR
jgi:succinylglutamic semialdehyde dehydrogenase